MVPPALVIGSGPAGVAAAVALLERGVAVTMVDAGVQLESPRRAVVERMGRQAPEQWSAEDLAVLHDGMEPTAAGVPLKRVYGSAYPYEHTAEHLGKAAVQSALLPSLAQGGLSNVWGSAMLPYAQRDLTAWPLSAAELAPHYHAVLGFTGLAGRNDWLETLSDLRTPGLTPLPLSKQAQHLWRNLERHDAALRRDGIYYGAARLAVKARRTPQDEGCILCGQCMYGCPYGYIYSTAHTLARLRAHPQFTYLSGIVAERLEERGSTVVVSGYELATRTPWRAEAERVYVGTGVIPSARLLLASMEAYGRPRPILDSQYFLFPLLQLRGTPHVREEKLYTLSQLFLELLPQSGQGHTTHLQVYSYSDLITPVIRQALGPVAWAPLVRALEGRLLIAQGYLHSEASSALQVELLRGPAGGELHVRPVVNPATAPAVRAVLRRLLRHGLQLGALPAFPMLKIAEPGRGFHSGGTFPMRSTPGEFESDTLGRVAGWNRVHLVDASVFPTIPATTITFSVMANAHRIAAQSL